MEYSSIQLNDLPDEIIFIILKKLNKLDVLYSLMDVNKRLNYIVHDPTFTNGLTLFNNLSCDCICPLPDLMLDRFCSQILPKIGHKIKWLDLEPFSMERILSTNYPNLFGLELHVKVMYIQDCLYLLDGRFNQLQIFRVEIGLSSSHSILIINKEKLPNLRCFSLSCHSDVNFYDTVLIPLLYRMSNLEQLSLYLSCVHHNRFINGNDLKENIIDYLPQLNQFQFNIRSTMLLKNQIDLPSNEDIQYTFKDFLNNEIISCVNYFPEYNEGICLIYSYPYTLRYYENIANNFPGGLFTCVYDVSLYDEHPFEHEFFIRIQKSFPFMERLTIMNRKAQNDKQCEKLKNTNQDLLVIEYSHLKRLILNEAHDDYVEQFLLDTKTCLPYGLDLHIDYKPLKRVTYNFKRHVTRINCSKIRYICSDTNLRFPKHFKDYFLDIDVS
ncbi:unnamed protein product [Rotaria sordida]|uniref:F-box domain-containing protein n=1 Tax=Rotaria sordida TaxID=392033 RepID=A0A819DC17_9BILA|nr:unnamed protein product [Rotaria sordida]CAF3826604.1 unnamed protein product [Rotaria sordida]